MLNLLILIPRNKACHPGDMVVPIMQRLFQRQGFAECRTAEKEQALRQPLTGCDVVILFKEAEKLDPAEEKHLCEFVRQGGGFVGVHAASDCSEDNQEYINLLGAKFVDHDPGLPTGKVFFNNTNHPLARDMSDFTITDEFYQLDVRDKKADVFLSFMRHGVQMPLALTKTYGKGRVFYMGLGHHEPVYHHPSFQRLLMRGVVFAAGKYPEKINPIGVGFLGFKKGAISEYHHRFIRGVKPFKPTAVCDISAPNREMAEKEFGLKSYSRPEDMLKDDNVRMVVIAIPPYLHCPEALRAMESGRHVVVEKPLALSMDDADRMMECARRNKVMLACFQNRRWDQHYLASKRLIGKRENLGEVFEIRLDFGGYMSPSSDWRSDKKLSGGNLYDMGAHGIDWILNLIDKPVVGVSGYCLHRMWPMATNETHSKVVIRFRDGETATYTDSLIHAGKQPESLTILGTEGSIIFPKVFDDEMQWTRVMDGKQISSQVNCCSDGDHTGSGSLWAQFYHDIADHLLLGLPKAVTPESSARVTGIIETAYKSAELGRELPFDDKYFCLRI